MKATKTSRSYNTIKTVCDYDSFLGYDFDGYFHNKMIRGDVLITESLFKNKTIDRINNGGNNWFLEKIKEYKLRFIFSNNHTHMTFFYGDIKSIYSKVDYKGDRIFLNVSLLCHKLHLLNYLRKYFSNVSLVGDNLLIQIIIV